MFPARSIGVDRVAANSTPAPSGKPGQIITLALNNVGEPDRVGAVAWTLPGGDTRARADLWSHGGGRTTGARALRPRLYAAAGLCGRQRADCHPDERGGWREHPVHHPFLTYTGDAVADFRALVDRVSATIKDSIAQQKSVPEWAVRRLDAAFDECMRRAVST